MHSQHLTIACVRCGRAAAEISLLPATDEGESQWRDKDRLERTDFIGTLIRFGPYQELRQYFEALRRADYAAARSMDPDFVAFCCRMCDQPYCATCWDIGSPVFDEGFYDYTSGTCPEGHDQIIDD